MKFRRATTTIAATLTIVAGGLVTASSALAQQAPSCITTKTSSSGLTRTVTATNNCGVDMHLVIVWQYATDSDCLGVGAGYAITSQRAYPAKFIRVDRC